MPRLARAILSLSIAATLMVGCGGSGGGTNAPPVAAARLSPVARLGEHIFFDTSLSASGRMSCATCHDPSRAHAAPTRDAVPFGGVTLDVPGFRNAPSLNYLAATPRFTFDNEGAPLGGFDRDGRADTLADQAERPFLADHEMANASIVDVVAKLANASYADDFRNTFGADVFDQPLAAFERARFALQTYQLEDPDFAPFSSKYDAFLAGTATLTDAELRGLALFNSPLKGNCAACHPSAPGADGAPPLFTDFSYDNLGVPRNDAIPANADPDYFDLGLCGPFRDDLATQRDLCGAFKVPTLRNVALTAPYFHNGRFETLREALRFYVRRDTNPEEFYPLDTNGVRVKFDDLPPEHVGNVNVTEAPYNRPLGGTPALTDAEINDVVSFLETLTDGYQP